MKSAFMVPICLFVGLSIAMDAMAQRDKGLIVWSSNRHTRDAGQPPTSNRDLWVMEANDGENRVRLTDHPKNEEEPAWSPDGTQIIFTSNRDGRNDIFIIDVDKDRLGRITSETHKGGWKVAVKMNNNMRNLTNNPAKTDESPTWAANGQTIAFMSRRDGNREIYLMRSDGGGQRNLTNHPAQDREPVFSYDGKKIGAKPSSSPPSTRRTSTASIRWTRSSSATRNWFSANWLRKSRIDWVRTVGAATSPSRPRSGRCGRNGWPSGCPGFPAMMLPSAPTASSTS